MAAAAPHLLVAISSHGFGHVAQVAPVLNALRARLPALRLTLRTAAPLPLLESRIAGPFALQPVADDFGMCMLSALRVDVEASAAAYRDFHADWGARLARTAAELDAVRPDLVLADVPYLSLAAAERIGVPALALCSLNWLDIYRHYCGGRPEAPGILDTMHAAYASAREFLRPAPAMPMEALPNGRAIGPVAAPGRARRTELLVRLGLPPATRLVLAGLGGVPHRLDVARWPVREGLCWLVPQDWRASRPDMRAIESAAMPYADLLASCDLLLTKPGYGSFTEAALAGVPVLYVPRGDWPEEPALVEWLHRHGRAAAMTQTALEQGSFTAELEALLAGARPAPIPASGVAEAAERLAAGLGE